MAVLVEKVGGISGTLGCNDGTNIEDDWLPQATTEAAEPSMKDALLKFLTPCLKTTPM